MKLIPVLDLMGGKVVYATGKERKNYLPLISPFTKHSDPIETVTNLLDWYPFSYLYLADLDSLMSQGDNYSIVAKIALNFPKLKLWLDSGVTAYIEIEQLFTLGITQSVIGTESITHLTVWKELQNTPYAKKIILSLDYKNNHFVDSAGLAQKFQLWPEIIIGMDLDSVGSQKGLNWQFLSQLKAKQAKNGKLFAAGGISSLEDLQQLKTWDASGALIASILHYGHLNPRDLVEVESPKSA
ncbi:HisA/HisF-related TIM barrel protein [Candidatus Nitrosacidococcus tergens]|uniref:Histidine biosynthesis protein n=1 Tax=Candidatus Nitrosacidococcus tergens TaxID=553981 RepID=A0A7G1Q7V9_9GAMM|nr:HisA/HisF-related TIM barrel protein [Candidatus Nitrosacidococcus tergens]CAB1274261.1 Histidine biosynthesis protein [Candidatus Nitrosacidococcus tergens]